MALSVIGVDFKTAKVEAREQLALSPEQTLSLLHVISAERMFDEAMILSTCNRTEFYFDHRDANARPLEHLLAHLAQVKNAQVIADMSIFYGYRGIETVRHLFRVAASLESQIIGEHEIVGQVKEAYRLSCEARMSRFLFHKLLHWTLRASKRVHSQTLLGQGSVSISRTAVDLANQVFTRLSGKTVMLVGAGQTAELAAQALVREGVTRLIVANRTVQRAEQLAESFRQWHDEEAWRKETDLDRVTCPALKKMLADCPLVRPAARPNPPPLEVRAIALEELSANIAQADLLISSTGAGEAILRRSELSGPLHGLNHSLLMIDIAVPRDIEPSLAELPNVYLYNIDDLETLVAQNIQRRQQEIPKAQAIIDSEVEQFANWLSSLGVLPTIKLLEERMARLQQAEIARHHRRFAAGEESKLQEFARTLCNKILHDPLVFLRQCGNDKSGADLASVNILRQIFNLDTPEDPS